MSQPIRFTLSQADMPQQWYNLLADFPEPVRDINALWWATPWLRAVRLGKALQTLAYIY